MPLFPEWYAEGVLRGDPGLGVDLLRLMEMGLSAQKAGIQGVDTQHQIETNRKIRAVSEWLGGSGYKRYRVYGKDL